MRKLRASIFCLHFKFLGLFISFLLLNSEDFTKLCKVVDILRYFILNHDLMKVMQITLNLNFILQFIHFKTLSFYISIFEEINNIILTCLYDGRKCFKISFKRPRIKRLVLMSLSQPINDAKFQCHISSVCVD